MADEIQLYRGDAGNVTPVYVMPTGEMQPVRQDLAQKLMVILESYERGQMAIADVQNAQNFILAKCREDYAQSLATVERMSDRALSATETTIAHLVKTNETLANALAAKSSSSNNVSVKIEATESRDRIIWIDPEWFAVWVLICSVFGLTCWMAIATSVQLQPRPQSASPQVEVKA